MFDSAQKILVISGHADDMELGAGATIHKLAAAGKEIYSLVLSLNTKGMAEKYGKDVISEECYRSGEVLGLKRENIFIEKFENRIFPEKRQEILDTLIQYKKKIQPDLVITGSLDDMHQDHATVAQESFRAFKDLNLISYGFDWNRINKHVNLYSVISQEDLEKKIEACLTYESQIEGRNYFSEEYIRAWAVTRGAEMKAHYAETFEVIRMIYV